MINLEMVATLMGRIGMMCGIKDILGVTEEMGQENEGETLLDEEDMGEEGPMDIEEGMVEKGKVTLVTLTLIWLVRMQLEGI